MNCLVSPSPSVPVAPPELRQTSSGSISLSRHRKRAARARQDLPERSHRSPVPSGWVSGSGSNKAATQRYTMQKRRRSWIQQHLWCPHILRADAGYSSVRRRLDPRTFAPAGGVQGVQESAAAAPGHSSSCRSRTEAPRRPGQLVLPPFSLKHSRLPLSRIRLFPVPHWCGLPQLRPNPGLSWTRNGRFQGR